MKTTKLSFFNPEEVVVDLNTTPFLNDVVFTEGTNVLSFKVGELIQQIQMPVAQKDDLVNVTLVDGELTLVTESSSIVVGNVTWDDDVTIDSPGTGVLDTDGNFYPLVGNGGITVTENANDITLEYGGTAGSGYKVGQALVHVSTPTNGTSYQIKTLTLADAGLWHILPINFVNDPQSMGLSIGPNGGVILPAGTYELNAKTSAFACNRFIININDGVKEITRSMTEWVAGNSSGSAGEQFVEAFGYYKCDVPTEIFISALSAVISTYNTPRLGRVIRMTSAWINNPPAATIDIFKVDDYVGAIPLQPVMTPLLPIVTANSGTGYITSASTTFSATYAAWRAFTDADPTLYWAPEVGTLDPWVQIELTDAPVVANVLMFCNRSDNVAGNFYNRACRVLYKPDDISDWIVAVETDDLPRHFGSCAFVHFGQYLTIKQLRLIITDSIGNPSVHSLQLFDFQQPTT